MVTVGFDDLVRNNGWTVTGAFCSPKDGDPKTNYTIDMKFILRTLRDEGKIPDKVNGRWKLEKDSDAHKIAAKELQAYMDAAEQGNHTTYIKEFKRTRDVFQIQVRTNSGKTITLDGCKGSDTIADVKAKIAEKEGARGDARYVAGPQLEDSHTLEDYNLGKDSTIFEVGRGRGGAPKVQPQDTIESIETQSN